jgi:hypothetical protein
MEGEGECAVDFEEIYIVLGYCSWKVGLSTGRLAWDSIAGVIED